MVTTSSIDLRLLSRIAVRWICGFRRRDYCVDLAHMLLYFRATVVNQNGSDIVKWYRESKWKWSDYFKLIKHGNLSLEVRFVTTLPTTINFVVYAEFDNLLQADKTKNVVFDFATWTPYNWSAFCWTTHSKAFIWETYFLQVWPTQALTSSTWTPALHQANTRWLYFWVSESAVNILIVMVYLRYMTLLRRLWKNMQTIGRSILRPATRGTWNSDSWSHQHVLLDLFQVVLP